LRQILEAIVHIIAILSIRMLLVWLMLVVIGVEVLLLVLSI
jgi:hypothetical protein